MCINAKTCTHIILKQDKIIQFGEWLIKEGFLLDCLKRNIFYCVELWVIKCLSLRKRVDEKELSFVKFQEYLRQYAHEKGIVYEEEVPKAEDNIKTSSVAVEDSVVMEDSSVIVLD